MQDLTHETIFEEARPALLGLAYRILGARADAEDAVQDTFLRWMCADRNGIENKWAWLTTVCTRRCLDLLQVAHRTRVNYVGAWLPEPIHTPTDGNVQDHLERASSLTTAFLLMLERLTPKERAAYLLHEIFDSSYAEIAETLDIRETACRKLVSRAKSNIDQTKVRHTTPLAQQDQLLTAFQTAIESGATAPLVSLLAEEIQLDADGGGKVPSLLEALHGKDAVIGFLCERLHEYWADYLWLTVDINGARGVVLKTGDAVHAAVSFAYDGADKVTNIFIVRNPDKLTHLDAVVIH